MHFQSDRVNDYDVRIRWWRPEGLLFDMVMIKIASRHVATYSVYRPPLQILDFQNVSSQSQFVHYSSSDPSSRCLSFLRKLVFRRRIPLIIMHDVTLLVKNIRFRWK